MWLLAISAGLALVVLLARSRPSGRRQRGARVRSGRREQRRAARGGARLTLAGVGVAPADECRHFKLLGTTGTGKSSAIRELLSGAIARGDRAIIADPDGAYRRAFYSPRRGDLILNPFDRDSMRWDLFGEIAEDSDVDQVVSALIARSEDAASQEWRGYGRTLLAGTIRACRARRRFDLGELWRLTLLAPPDELRSAVLGTPAQAFLEPENARMFGSIRAVVSSAMASLEHVMRQRARGLSLRRWVREPRECALLFLPYAATQIPALKHLIACWMRLAIFQALSGREGVDQRLWFVIDELDALGSIDGLKDALARLRKFGGRCLLGFQSIAQVSGTYGSADAQTIVENCGSTLILRCSSSEHGGSAQFASRLIGEREVRRWQRSRGRDGGYSLQSARRSRSATEQWALEQCVLAAEIEQLPDLCGYYKCPSSSSWLKIHWRPFVHD
jgi:type IV secretory pathway TraG/TraD family ATPase VirD4